MEPEMLNAPPPNGPTREDVALPDSARGKLAFVLYDVLSPEECARMIDQTETNGYEAALVNIGGGRQQLMTDVRNNDRCIIDSEEIADIIWDRVKHEVPELWDGCRVVGLNERLRFLRYDPGQEFKAHFDGNYVRDNGEHSCLTLQLYLNEGFEGGSTAFVHHDTAELVHVVPRTGSVLIFQHDILHQGSELIRGRKYAMRTDIMYYPHFGSH